jgi:hypothetical protein
MGTSFKVGLVLVGIFQDLASSTLVDPVAELNRIHKS